MPSVSENESDISWKYVVNRLPEHQCEPVSFKIHPVDTFFYFISFRSLHIHSSPSYWLHYSSYVISR